MRIIMDIETDGLLENVTKIHCLSYLNIDTDDKIVTLVDYNEMKKLLSQDNLEICGHNIIRYDIPVLEKLLNIKIKARLIDSLALSWYLYPMKKKHGLEQWGDELGVKKPEIEDWTNLKIADYKKVLPAAHCEPAIGDKAREYCLKRNWSKVTLTWKMV